MTALLLMGSGCQGPISGETAGAEVGDGASSSGATTGDSTSGTTDEGGESSDDGPGFLPESDIWMADLGPPDSHAEDMQPIWTQNCVIYCHAVGMEPPAEDLDLFEGAWANIVDRPSTQVPAMMLVTPFEPEQSYLWHKLNGTHLDVGGEGDPMPATGVTLDDETLARIEGWILAGADP